MDSMPPLPIGPGQRLLAAIVFTDVVSFSARMQAEEVVTLGLLEQDFAQMRKLAEKYSGSVLKTTGDGLLLYFTSAVNAVACAQKMQRDFGERARQDPGGEHLTHRVGIHLGDVFVNNDDVMGDGVNIAARLQAQAEPGGICISQTVYDVVKNKIELDVAKLEPRELKNISEAITIYKVLLERPKQRLRPAQPASSPLLQQAPEPQSVFTPRQKLLICVALLAGLGVAALMFQRAYQRHQDELAQNAADRALLQRQIAAPAPVGSQAAGPVQPPGEAGPDFAALSKAGAALDPADRQQAEALVRGLLAWLDRELQNYSADRPLLVRSLSGSAGEDSQVFTKGDHKLYYAQGGAVRTRELADLKPEALADLAVSAITDAPVTPPRDVIRGADAYAWLHGRPEMSAALPRK